MRSLIVCCLCLLASGCSQVVDILSSVPDKINKAFPPVVAVQVAEAGLRADLEADSSALRVLERDYAAQLELRALNCAKGISIGRFSTVATVREQPISRDCLNQQDEDLLRYLGVRRVALRLARPPLRPFKPLGTPTALPSLDGMIVSNGDVAPAAAVAVLQSVRGEYLSVELPSGRKIASLPAQSWGVGRPSLAPNGRVVVLTAGRDGLVFIDTETGTELWTTKKLSRWLGWLPGLSAGLAREGATGGATMLVDFQRGQIEPHPTGLSDRIWALPLDDGRVLMGALNEFSMVAHARSGQTVTAEIVRTYRPSQATGGYVGQPFPMRDGRALVFVSGRGIAQLDLETGAEKGWPTEGFLLGHHAKLDEVRLLVDSAQADIGGTRTWVLDIENGTLAPVDSALAGTGHLLGLTGRVGFLRHGRDVLVGDIVEAGEPVPLDRLVGEFNLRRQEARLEEAWRNAEFLSGGYRAGYPVPVTALAPASAPSAPAPSAPAPPAPMPSAGMLGELARVSLIEAVGVYQGKHSGERRPGQPRHGTGTVTVRVRASDKPIILVLSAYEAVRWILLPESGADIAAVLYSGYHTSKVVGARDARVIMIGSDYAYRLDSAEYRKLNWNVRRWTGRDIEVFQGRYEGESFSVGG
ncbi:MAG: hypothetical protein ACOZB0_10250 [Pseudomonadota bacterium]